MASNARIFGLIAAGCAVAGGVVYRQYRALDEPVPVKVPPVVPVSLVEAQAIADQAVTALTDCDGGRLGALIDRPALAARAAVASKLPAAQQHELVSAFPAAGKLADEICRTVRGHDGVVLRIRQVDGQPAPLLRFVDDAVAYLELRLSKDAAGATRIVDALPLMQGALMSEILGDFVAAGTTRGGASQNSANAKLQEVRSIAESDPARARALMEELPPWIRERKATRLTEVLLSADDEPLYRERIAAYEQAYPDDVALPMVSLDRLFLEENWAAVVTSLDKVEAWIGGDPWLDALEAQTYVRMGQPAKAVEVARAATVAEPTLTLAWDALIDAALAADDWTTVASALDDTRRRFDYDPATDTARDFTAFRASKPGKAWALAHP